MDVLPCFWYAQTLSDEVRIRLNVLVGLPLAIICMWGSTLVNAALFALIFPFVSIRLRGSALALLTNVPLVHHNGDARAPPADRPLQSVFSCLRVLGRTDPAPFPIPAYPSSRLRPRDFSQRLYRERAQPLYEVSQGNSPGDIFPRPRWRGQWEDGGR